MSAPQAPAASTDTGSATLGNTPTDPVAASTPHDIAGYRPADEQGQSHQAAGPFVAPYQGPAPYPSAQQGLSARVKNAIIAGGVGLAVVFGLLGFGAGYIVGDHSSSQSTMMPGGGFNGGGFSGGGMNGGGMNGGPGMGGMNGGPGMGGGTNGQLPGQSGSGSAGSGSGAGQLPGQSGSGSAGQQTPGGTSS